MKKNLLVIFLVVTSVVNATPEKKYYIGANVGVSISAHKDLYKNLADKNNTEYKFNNTDTAYGIHAGYKFNPYFATELSVGHLGEFNTTDVNNDNIYFKHNHNTVFALAKVSLPAIEKIGLDLYAKAGIGYISTKYNEGVLVKNGSGVYTKQYSNEQNNNTYSVPIVIGTELTITDSLTANIEYQYIHYVRHDLTEKVNKADEYFTYMFNDFKPSIHSTKIGLTYYFGKKKSGSMVEKSQPISLASDSLFNLGNSSKLTGNGIKAINELAERIKQERIGDQTVIVSGHTDRLGSAKFNTELSERRANTVAEQLITSGVSNVAYIGYGSEQPITGEQCADIKGRKALIDCYAPDRRIEIKISREKR